MATDTGNLLSTLVNSYTGALISVSRTVGIDADFVKTEIRPGINAPGSRVAALIGIVGGIVHSTASLMADMPAFEAYVSAFTGGMVRFKYLADEIIARVKFLAPLEVIPGEEEMSALAFGALRVLRGEEPAKNYAASKCG